MRRNRHRVRQEDMFNSMQPTKKQSAVSSNVRFIGDAERTAIVFTIRGKEDFWDKSPFSELGDTEFPLLDDVVFDNGNTEMAEDRDEAFAKVVYRSDWDQPRYYIKMGRDARFINPMGFDENQYHKRVAGELVKPFKPVNKKAFIAYITFLQTKNKAHLYEAEREMA